VIDKWTLDEFREELNNYIEAYGRTYETLELFFFGNRFDLPDYPQGFVDINRPRREHDEVKPVETIVHVNQLRGNSWVFKNESPDMKPLSNRLADLFLSDNPDEFPAIPAIKISNNLYFAGDDGNHRIYAAYLRGIPIKIRFSVY